MAAEQQLERSVLERKEREELRAIADAMALDTNSRSKKADIIDQILRAAGVDATGAESTNGTTPARPRSRASTARSAASVDAELTPADAPPTNGDSTEHANGAAPPQAASNGQSDKPEATNAADAVASTGDEPSGESEGATVTQAERPAPVRQGQPGQNGPGQNRQNT